MGQFEGRGVVYIIDIRVNSLAVRCLEINRQQDAINLTLILSTNSQLNMFAFKYQHLYGTLFAQIFCSGAEYVKLS